VEYKVNPHILFIECKCWEIPEFGATMDMGLLEITAVPFGDIFSFFKLRTWTSLKLKTNS